MTAYVNQLSLMTQLNKKLVWTTHSFEAVFDEQKKAEMSHNKLLCKKSRGRTP